MYRFDLTPAALKIDGPMNIILNNRIGGNKFNGIWG